MNDTNEREGMRTALGVVLAELGNHDKGTEGHAILWRLALDLAGRVA